jgi:hypothetical protein
VRRERVDAGVVRAHSNGQSFIDRASVVLMLPVRVRCGLSLLALLAAPTLWVLLVDWLQLPVPVGPTTLLVLSIWWIVLMRVRLVFWRAIRGRARRGRPR